MRSELTYLAAIVAYFVLIGCGLVWLVEQVVP